jgi:hypothetical protein
MRAVDRRSGTTRPGQIRMQSDRYPRAGLSEAQIDAVATVGIGTDEPQELLLRAMSNCRRGG